MPKIPLRVQGKDLANLKESGLKDATIRANKLWTEFNPVKLAEILNQIPEGHGKQIPLFCHGGLVFPYYDLHEDNGFHRVRPHGPRVRNGKPVKYEHPKGQPHHLYLPKSTREMIDGGCLDFTV